MIEKVDIPPGACGSAQVDHFEVEASPLNFIRYGARAPSPGRYTRLTVSGVLMMTDTPAEMRDHYAAVRMANGHVLITGLGLGMVANAIAKKPQVETVTVVEISADVISLVSAYLHPKIKVICADAFAYLPQKDALFGVVWHDIWPNLCVDNLSEMARLKRRFARRADWQGCWGEDLLRAQKRREQRETRCWR